MTKLNNVEKIEKILYSSGYFSIKNVVLTGSKGKNDIKLNAVYDRSYNSTKYSDRPQLESITVRTSDFLAIAFNNFTDRINEEIFISYPHMINFMDAINEAVDMVNTPEVFSGNQVSAKHAETVIKVNNLAGGKSLAIIPHVIQHDQAFVRGIMLFLNSDDIMVTLDVNQLATIQYILSGFNLYSASANLLLTGLMYDSNGSDTPEVTSFGNKPSTGSNFGGSSTGGTKRSIFGGAGGNKRTMANSNNNAKPTTNFKKPTTQNTSLDDLDSVIENGSAPEYVPPTDEHDSTTKPFGNPEETVSSGKVGSPLSLDAIISASNEIEIPDLDDGAIDFD